MSKMKADLEYIVSGCRRRQPAAQKMLYDRFAPAMLGVCMRYAHSRDEAQDILHDGFVKIYESIGQLQKADAVEAWMYRIMVNKSLNYVMRNRQVVYTDIAALEEYESLDGRADGLPWEDDAYTLDQIVGAIQELPEHYRLAFNMREVEEMEYAVIAAHMGQAESTVRCTVTRARKMLRDKLQNIKKD